MPIRPKPGAPLITRRRIVSGATALVLAPATLSRAGLALAGGFRADPFALGVASGDPDAGSVVIWTRLAPDPLAPQGGMGPQPVTVEWQVAADETMSSVVARGEALAVAELGHSVHVVVEGLQPGRHYWYRFRCDGALSPTGRTKTLPKPDGAVDAFTVAVAGCQKIQDGFYTAWVDIAASDVDLVFHYGDYIYEGQIPASAISLRLGRSLPAQGPKRLRSLEDYRQRYAVYKLDPDLAAVHAAHPFAMSFDDHEVVNNWAGADRRYDALRLAALQAYYENLPIRPSARLADGWLHMHRSFTVGSLVRLAVLDTRQHRSPQACDARGKKVECAERLDSGRTMLGAAQERWVDDLFARKDTQWTALASQVMMMQERLDDEQPPAVVNTDKWDGYVAARTRLLDSAARNRVSGLVVLSGDRHIAMAGNLHRDFDDPSAPVLGVELLATSVSSGRDGRAGRGKRAKRLNPHLRLYDRRRGSLVCTFRKDRLEAEFRVLDGVSVRGLPVRVLARFEIDPRRPEI